MAPYRCLGSAEFAGVAIAAELLADSLRRLCEGSANLQAMPAHRMNRDEFYRKLAPLDEERLKKALWTLYWRGSVPVRERIEAVIATEPTKARGRVVEAPPDAGVVRKQVEEFATLARAGAYLGRDRRVSPKERTRWRFTFRALVKDCLDALRGEEVDQAAAAVATLVDLACEMKSYDYVRSEDPVEAARFVVSDVVGVLWSRLREVYGVDGLLARAVPQMVAWESAYGWTRFGTGWVADRETALAPVLARLLVAPESWYAAAALYLDVLDETTRRGRGTWGSDVAEWNALLVDKLVGSDDEHLLQRLVAHPRLTSGEVTALQERLAQAGRKRR
jgi:hypothetical protein